MGLKNTQFEDEVQVSYFVKTKKSKNPRLGSGRLLDISNVGLCMEISPTGSELYMESGGKLFLINKNIELQIFCRSYPNNISLEGTVKWIQREHRPDRPHEEGDIFVGVIFSFPDGNQRKYLAEFVELFRNDTGRCGECGAPVSVDAPLCYRCGARLVRKRTFLRNIINSILSGNKSSEKG